MARPLRVEYPNACYHVINRGNRRERVYQSENDYLLFLEKLVEYADLYDVIIYSYCLMPNHFHLYLRTRHGNLGKFMQSFLTSFTIIMNRRYNKSGHLFQGRYKAQLVESELYKNKLSRYIHLNPVKVQALKHASLAEIRQELHDFKWSSFRSYIGIEKKPKWLNRSHVLSSWGRVAEVKMKNYRQYVEEGIETNNADDLTGTEIRNIIGSDSFIDKIIKKYLLRDHSDIDEREQPVLKRINALQVMHVINAVSIYYKLASPDQVTVRKACHQEARKVAMFLACKHCRRKETLSSIAMTFGVKISGLNMARDKFAAKLKEDKDAQKRVSAIEKTLRGNDESV